MTRTSNPESKIPEFKSYEEEARFWDTHDLTDFASELEEVTEPLFERDIVLAIHLSVQEAQAVKKLARTKGMADTDLIHEWVREKLQVA